MKWMLPAIAFSLIILFGGVAAAMPAQHPSMGMPTHPTMTMHMPIHQTAPPTKITHKQRPTSIPTKAFKTIPEFPHEWKP